MANNNRVRDNRRYFTVTTTEVKGDDDNGEEVYRYRLMRIWNQNQRPLLIIGCNPSTANAMSGDPTMDKVSNIAMANGYGGVIMSNLYAFRATDPTVMKARGRGDLQYVIGHNGTNILRNNLNLIDLDEASGLVNDVVFAYGNIGVRNWGEDQNYVNQYPEQLKELLLNQGKSLYAFDLTKFGHPGHPLPRSNQFADDFQKYEWAKWHCYDVQQNLWRWQKWSCHDVTNDRWQLRYWDTNQWINVVTGAGRPALPGVQ